MDTKTSLTQERWRRIEEVYLELTEVPTEQQPERLDALCQNDPELRRHVARMLECHDGDAFLENPGVSPLDPELHHERLKGRRIGAFRLIEPIATGGMGTVWLGERDDDVKQRVALKLINWGLVAAERRRFFEKERRALAQLEHPYVTRLIDGGTTSDGLPYLVMEYVEGKPLDVYCDENKLTIRERLALFRKVCEAVNYAHQNLIVHRDLKPSNILVSVPSGQPKLLDFGVSKLLDDASAADQAEATITVVRAFTPRYASPEEVRGGVITTASDVYSLGVLLYELLTGARPYVIDGATEFDRAQQICESEPELPSRIVLNPAERTAPGSKEQAGLLRGDSPDGLRRRLRGDLDTIVLKAMQKEPARRYASAEQLSEDIRRFLTGMPVHARKDTIPYRLSKFVLRNRAVVVATTVVLFTLISATVGIAVQWQNARADRDRARSAQRTAETITTVFQNTLFAINPERRGGNASLFMLLSDATRHAESELVHDPLALARVRYAIGSTYAALLAFPSAERHLRPSLHSLREHLGSDDPETANCLDDLGWLRVQIGEVDGVDLLREAIEIRTRLYGEDQRIVADAKCRLAYGLAMLDSDHARQEAMQLLQQSEAVYRKRFDDPHPTFAFQQLVHGWLAEAGADTDTALRHYRAARDSYNASGRSYDAGYLMTVERIASLMEQRGNFAAARRLRLELVEMTHTLYGEVLSRGADWDLARLEHRGGDPQSALRGYVRAVRNLCMAWYRNMPASGRRLANLGKQLDAQVHRREIEGGEIGRLCSNAIEELGRQGNYSPELRASWLIDISAALFDLGADNSVAILTQMALETLGEDALPSQKAGAQLVRGLLMHNRGEKADADATLREVARCEDWGQVVLTPDHYWQLSMIFQELGEDQAADRTAALAAELEELRERRGALTPRRGL